MSNPQAKLFFSATKRKAQRRRKRLGQHSSLDFLAHCILFFVSWNKNLCCGYEPAVCCFLCSMFYLGIFKCWHLPFNMFICSRYIFWKAWSASWTQLNFQQPSYFKNTEAIVYNILNIRKYVENQDFRRNARRKKDFRNLINVF